MGMATYIEQSVNNALDHYVVTSSDAVIGVLTPVAVAAMTLYVMWTGFQVMRGDVQEPVTALVWRWFRVALITGLTLNGPQYRSLVKEGLDGIQEAFASAFGGVLSMGGTIDQMADPFTTLMETLFTEASSGLVPQFSLFIAGGICATASIVMAFVAMGLFLVAKVSLAPLLSVGPAFIFCAMFPATSQNRSYIVPMLAQIQVPRYTVHAAHRTPEMGPESAGRWGLRQVEQAGMRSRLVQFLALQVPPCEGDALLVILGHRAPPVRY